MNMHHQLLKQLESALNHSEHMNQWLEQCKQSMEPLYQAIQEERSQQLELVYNHRQVTQIPINPEFEHILIEDLYPGLYQLQTSTGWQLWEQRLSESDLIIERDKPLALAASTESLESEPNLAFSLMDGWLHVEVHCGIHHGSMLIRR